MRKTKVLTATMLVATVFSTRLPENVTIATGLPHPHNLESEVHSTRYTLLDNGWILLKR